MQLPNLSTKLTAGSLRGLHWGGLGPLQPHSCLSLPFNCWTQAQCPQDMLPSVR